MKLINAKSKFAFAVLAGSSIACSSQDTTCVSEDGSACAASAPEAEAPYAERLQALEADIGLGESGTAARTVNEFLTRGGYFPNEELRAQHSSWLPVLEFGPERLDVFDAQTERAVFELQRRFGLETTGVVDEPTRAHMTSLSCGTPEIGSASADVDKFSLQGVREIPGQTWPITLISWSLGSVTGARIGPDCLATDDQTTCTTAQLRARARPAIQAAFDAWSAQTNLSFFEDIAGFPTTPNITIDFADLSALAPPPLADGSFPSDTNHPIRIGSHVTWTVANPVSSSGPPHDLQDVMMHEVGHVLGLNHSSISGAKMRSSTPYNRTLSLDDRVAISTLYDIWEEVPGAGRATDIGAGADGSDAGSAPDVWALGVTLQSGGYGVYQWTGSSYQLAVGNRFGTAISVSGTTGVPWIVSSSRVYERTSTSASTGSWTIRGANDCARDVAAGPNGSAWRIGCTAVNGGFNVAFYNASTQTWTNEAAGVAAVRIAVEQGGAPWVINSQNEIYRKPNATWEKVPGAATDIGAGPTLAAGKGYVFALGMNNGDVHVWNEQNVIPGDPFGPASKDFRFFGGGATRIAVDPNGSPWAVAADGTIWRTTR